MDSFPSNIIDIRDIQDVIDNYKKKISHFLIKLKNKEIHLKCDNYDEKNKWLQAIQYMRNKYSSSCYFNERKYKEDIDDETSLLIYAENEMRHWDEIKVGLLKLSCKLI